MSANNRPSIKITGVRCKCRTCGEVFRSAAGFDKHRVGAHGTADRRCMTEVEMTLAGMARGKDGLWVTRLQEPGGDYWPMASKR